MTKKRSIRSVSASGISLKLSTSPILMSVLVLLILTVWIVTGSDTTPDVIPDWANFPGEEWETITPEQAGLDAQKFRAWIDSQKPRFGKAYGG